MSGRRISAARLARALSQGGLVAVGLAAIVGSGGGLGIDWCDGCGLGPWTYPPSVVVRPAQTIVQVGSDVSFDAWVTSYAGDTSLQWCRRAAATSDCIDIAGATASRYVLAGANLVDDGARFEVRVSDAYGTAQDGATLAVSSGPPVRFEDGEFALADWVALAGPSSPGAGFQVAHETAGGNPDAWRSVTLTLPASGGSVRVFHGRAGVAYDPAAQGAVYRIDVAVDCARLRYEGSTQVPTVRPTIEQGGRRFAPAWPGWVAGVDCVGPWQAVSMLSALAADQFALVDGPPCGIGESCPDFSAQGAPIRLGFESTVEVGFTTGPVTLVLGVDNWRVAVWRR